MYIANLVIILDDYSFGDVDDEAIMWLHLLVIKPFFFLVVLQLRSKGGRSREGRSSRNTWERRIFAVGRLIWRWSHAFLACWDLTWFSFPYSALHPALTDLSLPLLWGLVHSQWHWTPYSDTVGRAGTVQYPYRKLAGSFQNRNLHHDATKYLFILK